MMTADDVKMATLNVVREISEDLQHDYQPQLATDLTHSSLSAGVSTGNGRIDVNLEEVDLSRDSLSEEGDADEEDSDEWCNVVCGSVKGRLCWEKLGDGRSKCIRWGNENEWVTPIEFEREGGKGRARKWKHSIRVVGGDILGKALVLRQNLMDQAVISPVQRQDTPNFCAVRGVPEAEQGLGSLNPEYEDGPADTEPSLQEETANLSGNSTGVSTELSEDVLVKGTDGCGTHADLSDFGLLASSKQYNGEGVSPGVAEPGAAVLTTANLLRMERRIAALENELVKQLKVNDMLEMRLKQLEKAHKCSIEVGSTGERGVPGSEPSVSTSLMDDRPAGPISPQLSKTVNGPSGHKSSLREAETEGTEVREGRGKLGGELQNVEAVPHSTCIDDLQTSVINKGHSEDASKGSERGSDEQSREKPEKRKEAETRKVERRSKVAGRSGCNTGSHYVGRRKVWGTRRSVTVESVTREIEKIVESKGEINVRRVEFNTEKGVKWWFWVESEERILQELTSKCNWEHWELQSMPFLGDAKVRVVPKKGRGSIGRGVKT